ncbi:LysR family transcriptional regulator [Variovorax sp. KK3]|uniref:LysR family transcriptional regulator n=1 Tax=Variovorax sp. KK3 TaxID=1855728 RepID=UPI00097C4004|nr:LysR family transcriptional regulator [Variovorax sp. KK3]
MKGSQQAAPPLGTANEASRINLQLLSYLVMLVSEEHVTRAADRMGISQPAMSTALARLRKVFKDPILVRTTSGMRPTARALHLAEKARVALELLDHGTEDGSFDPALASGHFRIMATEGVASVVMPELLATVRQSARNLRFTVMSGDIRRAPEFLRDGQLEFSMGFTQSKTDDLHQMLLYPQRIVCLASRAHPQIQGRLSFEQFIEQGHVVWGADPVPFPAIEALVDDALALRGVSRNVVARVANLSTSAALVASSDLLAIVPQRMALDGVVSRRCQVLPLPFSTPAFDVRLIWHARWHRDRTHIWLRQLFRQCAASIRSRCVGPE